MKIRISENQRQVLISAMSGATWAEKRSRFDASVVGDYSFRRASEALMEAEGTWVDVETGHLFDDQFNTEFCRVYLRNIDAVDFEEFRDVDGFDAAVDASRARSSYAPHKGTRMLRYHIEKGFVKDMTNQILKCQ